MRGTTPGGIIGDDLQELAQRIFKHEDVPAYVRFAATLRGVDPQRVGEMKDVAFDLLDTFVIEPEAPIVNAKVLRNRKDQNRGMTSKGGGASDGSVSKHHYLQEESNSRDQAAMHPAMGGRSPVQRFPGHQIK